MSKLTMLTATVAVGALLAGCSVAGDRTTSSRQSSTGASTAAAQPAPSAQVRQVQQALNSQGFYSGDADGIWGPRTADALRNFQQARGIEQSAQMDSRTMAALGLNSDGTPMSQTTTVPSATTSSTAGTTGTGMSSTSGTGMSGATGTGPSATTGATTGTVNQPATAPYPATGTTAGSATTTTRSAAPNSGTSSTRTPGNDRQNQHSAIAPAQQPAYGTASSARSSADLNRRSDQRASASGPMTSRTQVREVQESLERAGHDVGEVDGVWGPRTAKALRDFQQARGLDATGRLDDRSREALGVRGRS